jgi:hypothetical protein
MTATPLYPTVRSLEEAEALCALLEAKLDDLESVIREETDHLATARLADAFALHERKVMEVNSYERGLKIFRDNSIALARFKPTQLERIKMRQGSLQSTLEANLKTLQTLRTVSETILRGVASEVSASRHLSTYGKNGTLSANKRPTHASPLLVSGKY